MPRSFWSPGRIRTGESMTRSPSVVTSNESPASIRKASRTGLGSTRRPARSSVALPFTTGYYHFQMGIQSNIAPSLNLKLGKSRLFEDSLGDRRPDGDRGRRRFSHPPLSHSRGDETM